MNFGRTFPQFIMLVIFLGLSFSVTAAKPAVAVDDGIGVEKYKYGSFGEVRVFKKAGTPDHLILFAAGDGKWDSFFIRMVKAVVTDKTMVVAFDTLGYIERLEKRGKKCMYPAGDLELLSKYIQSKMKLKQYLQPVLVGYSSGATLGYGAMVQAPAATFQGGISLGFCSDLESKIPMCKGAGLQSTPVLKAKKSKKPKAFEYAATDRDMSKWFIFGGDEDQVCPMNAVETFIKTIPGAKSVRLPKVGHGFLIQKDWVPQFQSALGEIFDEGEQSGKRDALTDLPLVPLPAESSKSDELVIFLSGDGGWAGFDRDLSASFTKNGIPVVGWNSLKYFWTPKNADQGAIDLARVIEEYTTRWKKKKVILVGFSFGADVVPFFANRLPLKSQNMISKVIMISPGKAADFEFHFADWIVDDGKGLAIAPEALKIADKTQVLCLYGEDEEDNSVCPQLKRPSIDARKLPGGHHIDSDPTELYKLISNVGGVSP